MMKEQFLAGIPFTDGFDLAAQRRRKHLDQLALANHLNVTTRTIKRYEQLSEDDLRSRLTVKQIERIIDLLYT